MEHEDPAHRTGSDWLWDGGCPGAGLGWIPGVRKGTAGRDGGPTLTAARGWVLSPAGVNGGVGG